MVAVLAASIAVMTLWSQLFDGILSITVSVLVGQLVVGAAGGAWLPSERRALVVGEFALLAALLIGRQVLFPPGESWSGDLLAIPGSGVEALVFGLPFLAGVWVGSALTSPRAARDRA